MMLRRWAIPALAASLLALTACGGNSGDDASPSSSTDGSSSHSGDSGGFGDAQAAALTKKTFALALAKAATEAGSAHMVMQTSASGTNVSLTGDIGGLGERLEDLAMQMQIEVPGTGEAEMRIVDSDFYLKVPGLTSGSKSWARIPLDDPGNPFGALYQQMLTLSDPTALKAAYSKLQKFTYVGSETVDGVNAQHYRVSVNTAKSLRAAGISQIGGIPVSQLVKSMPKVVTSDLWIDSDRRIVKMASDNGASDYEVHYSKWGEPVHVSAPPAAQVHDLTP